MLNTKIRTDYLFISVAILFSFTFMYLSYLGNDNTSTMYEGMVGSEAYWLGQYANYRYVPALVGKLIYEINLSYYDFIYLWAVFFSLAIAYCCYEFLLYCKLPISSLPFMITAVSLNGYMADLYAFSMVYMAYGFAYLGVALALRAARTCTTISALFIGTTFSLLSLMSYQVTALILLFAASVGLVASTIQKKKENILYYLNPIIYFVLSSILFLLLKELIGPNYGRNVSASYIANNLPAYFAFLPRMLTRGFYPAVSAVQNYTYLLSLLVTLIMLMFSIKTNKWWNTLFALIAFAASILIIPNPITLLPAGFWPAARQMTATAFLFSGFCILIYYVANQHWKKLLYGFSIIFLAYSAYYQVVFFAFMKGQDERDQLAVELIISDISKVADITKPLKISVKTNSKNAVNSYNRLSAFNQPWSKEKIFHIHNNNFIKADTPPNACMAGGDNAWNIEKIDGIIVVCLK